MPDDDSNEERLARHRALHRVGPVDVVAAQSLIAGRRTALTNCQEQLQTAIGHLQAVLNKARTHDEQQKADTAARDWLTSIGSEPT